MDFPEAAGRHRQQAEECRARADLMRDERTREQFLKLAEAYDALAVNEDKMAGNPALVIPRAAEVRPPQFSEPNKRGPQSFALTSRNAIDLVSSEPDVRLSRSDRDCRGGGGIIKVVAKPLHGKLTAGRRSGLHISAWLSRRR
jgi:hypothetical protein